MASGYGSALSQWLVDGGHEVFLDQDLRDGIALGEPWEQRPHERLRWANAVVCVITSVYRDLVWCAAEIGAAQSRDSQQLSLRAGPNAVHPLLTALQHFDYPADPPAARVAVLAALPAAMSSYEVRMRQTYARSNRLTGCDCVPEHI